MSATLTASSCLLRVHPGVKHGAILMSAMSATSTASSCLLRAHPGIKHDDAINDLIRADGIQPNIRS
eukprot:2369635-Amphidinium_carterae.3